MLSSENSWQEEKISSSFNHVIHKGGEATLPLCLINPSQMGFACEQHCIPGQGMKPRRFWRAGSKAERGEEPGRGIQSVLQLGVAYFSF